VGTGNGLVQIDRERGEVVARYRPDAEDPTSLSGQFVFGLLEDSRGDFWVTTNNGWNRFDRKAGTFERFQNDLQDPHSLVSNAVRQTFEDSAGNLWITTSAGLSRFHRDSGTFTNYRHDPENPNSLSHSTVMGIYEDETGLFWLTTYGGGLNRFDPSTETFTHFTTKDGLPNGSLYGVLPDEEGRLWLSSNLGLSRFDPRRGTFENFDKDDGLQSNEFNDRAYFRSAEGVLYFGGLHGFNRFRPSEIRPSTYRPPVVLTAFRKAGQPVVLDRPLAEMDQVVVSYKENFFSFEFASLEFATPTKNS
jgi:ligand-binding sensor domain-containing protein